MDKPSVEEAAKALSFMETTLLALWDGPQIQALVPFMKALETLDLYLTGSNENRRQDESQVKKLLWDWMTYHVHLSDGGYSRITLREGAVDRSPIVFDYGLSRPRATEKWKELLKFIGKQPR